MPQIHTAIVGMLTDIEHIKKGQKNTQQGYQFRGIDDIYNTIHPLLAKHAVFPTCEVLSMDMTERETKSGGVLFFVRARYRYTFHATDGSTVSTEAIGEAMDSGDKASNKSMSNAYKYSIFQLLCIPTEAVDGDIETFKDVKSATPAKPAKSTWGGGTTTSPPISKPNDKPWSQMTEPEKLDSTLNRIGVIRAMTDKKMAASELTKLGTNPNLSKFSEANQVKIRDELLSLSEELAAANA